MTVTLSPEMNEFVQDSVDRGRFPSLNVAVDAGLRLLKSYEQLQQDQLSVVRADVEAGLEQADKGETAPLDMEEIKAAGRMVLAARLNSS